MNRYTANISQTCIRYIGLLTLFSQHEHSDTWRCFLPVYLIVLGAFPLPEVVYWFRQRMLAERRQLQMWLHVLLAHGHLALQARLDRIRWHGSGGRSGSSFLPVSCFLRNGGARGPVSGSRCVSADRGAVVAWNGAPGSQWRQRTRQTLSGLGCGGGSAPVAVVVGDVGQLEVFLKVGGAAVAVAALRAADAAALRLPLQVVEAVPAEVVAAGEQVGVAVQVQTHGAGELLLQDAGL